MPQARSGLAIELHDVPVGVLTQQGGGSVFRFLRSYMDVQPRDVLGLRFEENLGRVDRGSQRLPPWFTNLLPEGRLRDLINRVNQVTTASLLEAEFQLLSQLGGDLPGAIRVSALDLDDLDLVHFDDIAEDDISRSIASRPPDALAVSDDAFRFSVAGVGLKFSANDLDDLFVAPEPGGRGSWIIKMPDPQLAHLPTNEFIMMTLAERVGLDVPTVRLIHRDQAPFIADAYWGAEEHALAVERFDRTSTGSAIHIEDLAQVRGLYPEGKYTGSFESVASLVYRGVDERSLVEFARRLAFCICIGNGDAHLKNWSLIYENRQQPRLSPGYDLVSVVAYGPVVSQDLGLKLNGSRRYSDVRLASFRRMGERLNVSEDLSAAAREIAREVATAIDHVDVLQLGGTNELQRMLDHVNRMHGQLG